jgi:hypothetical protein
MDENAKDITGEIRESVANGDSDRLKAIVEDFATYCFKENPDGHSFNDEVFKFILETMVQPRFLDMKGAYHLLMLFEYDWAMLTPPQKEELISAIERTYDKFADWMSCFVLVELLDQYYCDENAFQLLCRLKNSTQEIPRSLLPVGFEKLVQNASDLVLKNRSLLELKQMMNDPSERVQKEASESVIRLTSK